MARMKDAVDAAKLPSQPTTGEADAPPRKPPADAPKPLDQTQEIDPKVQAKLQAESKVAMPVVEKYVVLADKNVSLNGHMARLQKGRVLDSVGYDIALLKHAGVPLEKL